MLPVTSALLPLTAQSHDELHRPDQKLERLSLKPEMPMLIPEAVEYAPAAPGQTNQAGGGGGGRERNVEAKKDAIGCAAMKCISKHTAFQISFSVLLTRLLGTFAFLLRRCRNLRVFQSARIADHTHNVVVPEQSMG
jgi:hypothetical protein